MWLKRSKAPELHGAPAVRRVKNYSAETGYVYQYWYCGLRPLVSGVEYVFEVAGSRTAARQITLSIESELLEDWMGSNQRELSGPERYGVIKVTLFRLFDEAPAPGDLQVRFQLTSRDLDQAASLLGLL